MTAELTRPWGLRDRVRTSAGEIATEVLGAGPPVVLVHGTPSWSYLWREIAAPLAEKHTVHLWDLPGYGDSRLADGKSASIALHARTLAELVDHWELDAPALVGHDIGGGAVLRAHLIERVPARSIAVLDAAVLSPWVTPLVQHVQRHPEVYRTMPSHAIGGIIAAHLNTATHLGLSESARAAYLDRFAGPPGQRRWLDQIAHFTEEDTVEVVEALGEITVPTHVIWGEHDQWLPSGTATRLADLIPGARRTIIPGAGHFLTEDAPAEVAAVLGNWLGSF
ncbi:alpha/beta fold hydrolase [Amycolatopsis sp. CA-230715]|uniref:alpha/beta fold hydrolase n=1 Tax=Amycolatopsis sp. CA-230715 TaxID=2745196 RepID=UPI001C015C69|nr:alpha/beta hydrolase [Amycolatopsis sp. CA-230715]QWF86038.1 Haloalkane dehalogenase 2 [Amycolatopsis sp. CA-230715]